MKAVSDAPVMTVIVLLLVVTGCLDVLLDGTLSADFSKLLGALDVPIAGVAIGRGVANRKAR